MAKLNDKKLIDSIFWWNVWKYWRDKRFFLFFVVFFYWNKIEVIERLLKWQENCVVEIICHILRVLIAKKWRTKSWHKVATKTIKVPQSSKQKTKNECWKNTLEQWSFVGHLSLIRLLFFLLILFCVRVHTFGVVMSRPSVLVAWLSNAFLSMFHAFAFSDSQWPSINLPTILPVWLQEPILVVLHINTSEYRKQRWTNSSYCQNITRKFIDFYVNGFCFSVFLNEVLI